MSVTTAPDAQLAACASCTAPLQGPYCHSCGEKRLDRHDYSLIHFLEHAVDTATHFDFKVVKGIWDLLVHPGRMTHDVLQGRRVPWPKPLQLFIIVNLLYVFLAHRVGMMVFNTQLQFHFRYWYGTQARTLMEQLAQRRHMPLDRLAEKFDLLADTLSKTLIFAFIPLLAVVLAGLLWRKRRYFLEHVLVATHLTAQILLVLLVLIAPYALVLLALDALGFQLQYEQRDNLSTIMLVSLITAWATPLLRRSYQLHWWAGLLAGFGCAVAFLQLLNHVYRGLLFLVTYALL